MSGFLSKRTVRWDLQTDGNTHRVQLPCQASKFEARTTVDWATQATAEMRQVLSDPASLLERVEVESASCESALPASTASFSEKITIEQDQFPETARIGGQTMDSMGDG
jgi:hypothetical protein